MVDENDVEDESEMDGSEYLDGAPRDYDRAFEVYAIASAPVQDLLRDFYSEGAVRCVAMTVRHFREKGMDRTPAGQAALASCLRNGWPDRWRN